MRIVLDLQACQSESRFRGMGRYSMSLAKAIAKNACDHEIWLSLNALFIDTIPYIRQSFEGLIPKERIFVFSAHGPVAEADPQNEWRARASELIREYVIISQLKPDIVHINSLFEGFFDDAVTSIGKFDSKILTAVTLYDLIPYVNPENYLYNEQIKKWYYRKIQSFKNASLFLAISEYSKKEAINNLGIAQENIINISAATDESFKPLKYSEEQKKSIFNRCNNIKEPFIMYAPGGFDERKNIKRLIEAYGMLPFTIKKEHQLVITGKIADETKHDLSVYAKKFNIGNNQLIFTPYLKDDDLIALYNLCKLFVYPSLYEGFGLPPLEAMACQAATIGSNSTSIPEVIGRQDALFDPFSAKSISDKIYEALTNDSFLNSLKEHALKQAKKFSWNESAKRAIEAFEIIHQNHNSRKPISADSKLSYKPRLAFLSPLPPERSGISNYSKELLPELALYYDICLIVDQPNVEDAYLKANFSIHDIPWFEANIKKFDRILYQFGNSPFHKHMFLLLKKYPGVVVLHDFYLGHVINWMEVYGYIPDFFKQSLYYSHGYNALIFLNENAIKKTVYAYPVNKKILDDSIGIIVHSQHSIEKAEEWYGINHGYNFSYIPHLRGCAKAINYNDTIGIRSTLGFAKDDFVICSFGFLGVAKLNHRLLNAFLNSSLCKCKNCRLIFVGENHGDDYGKNILETIKKSGLQKNIEITGFVDETIYQQYLSVCDVAVQLRSISRGETSGAVLDVLAHGIPLIVNAHGTNAEYPEDILIKLPDEFDDEGLINALEKLKNDAELREKLSIAGRKYILEHNNPKKIANNYFNAIENFYLNSEHTKYKNLINLLSNIDTNIKPSHKDIVSISESIANCSFKTSQKQLFIDISALVQYDLKTGIERVTKAIMFELLKNPPEGFRIEPIFFDGDHYRYARKFTFKFLNIDQCGEQCGINDDIIQQGRNDIFLGLDLNWEYLEARNKILRLYNSYGVKIYFIVYDLLPIRHPEWFPPGDTKKAFENWLKMIYEVSSGLISISKSTANDLINWFKENNYNRIEPVNSAYFHQGADIKNNFPITGIPQDAKLLLEKLYAAPTFLMVGTIEPRKGYLQAIEAFNLLWQENISINLVVVGKEGWKGLPINQRRTIPLILSELIKHQELNKHLFWLEGISDEYLEEVYKTSTCLIAASEGEGFGLPLIEAAHHKLPIIARGIAVFREVAGDYAFYFNGNKPEDLAKAIKDWLNLYKEGKHPKSDDMPWLTWKQSTEQLMNIIFNDKG
ncbi:glycosyl transferase, group 1 family protein [Desulfurella amilsii]|uniref:Glycosyl transferase, group 1 family protein n=1 Tax=Desulfurella amilsii TaxID=1562698 RepID=A0A1X4XY16_9BACT|nr:glycosyltransferase [Desulfurella amilsii]OSS42404.1 glycosyl transferase, group 1 family protein [Desulfurella amilsii]